MTIIKQANETINHAFLPKIKKKITCEEINNQTLDNNNYVTMNSLFDSTKRSRNQAGGKYATMDKGRGMSLPGLSKRPH